MPSRFQFQNKLTEAEERKRRQEKFRKRTRSLFNKARLLAKDTDAWVALIARDRAGRIQSFRSSNSFYWPPSMKDLVKQPSSTHEFLKKYAVSGFWIEVAEDESDSSQIEDDTDSFTGDVWAIRTIVGTEARSDSAVIVHQCYTGKEIGMHTPKVKTTKSARSQRSLVDALGDSDSTLVARLGESDSTLVAQAEESDGTTVDLPRDSDYTNNNVLVMHDNSSVYPLGKLYDEKSDLDGELDNTIVEFRGSGNTITDAIGVSNDTTPDEAMELDDITVDMLKASDNMIETTAVGMLNTIEVDLTAAQYDMMDLDMPGEMMGVTAVARGDGLIETANVVYTTSQHHCPQSSKDLDNWQVIDWPRTTHQDDRQSWGSKPIGINPKELLEGWDWVFQRIQRKRV